MNVTQTQKKRGWEARVIQIRVAKVFFPFTLAAEFFLVYLAKRKKGDTDHRAFSSFIPTILFPFRPINDHRRCSYPLNGPDARIDRPSQRLRISIFSAHRCCSHELHSSTYIEIYNVVTVIYDRNTCRITRYRNINFTLSYGNVFIDSINVWKDGK